MCIFSVTLRREFDLVGVELWTTREGKRGLEEKYWPLEIMQGISAQEEWTPEPSFLEGEMCMLSNKSLTCKIGMKLLPNTTVVRITWQHVIRYVPSPRLGSQKGPMTNGSLFLLPCLKVGVLFYHLFLIVPSTAMSKSVLGWWLRLGLKSAEIILIAVRLVTPSSFIISIE